MTSSSRPSLKLLSLNVNGLGGSTKRRTLFSMLATQHFDIVFLQETHHRDVSQGEEWAREGAGQGRPWGGSSFWCHGTTASCGVAVLVAADSAISDPVVSHSSTEGRFLRLDFTWEDQGFSVVNVYAPSQSAHRRAFFLGDLAPALPADRHILLGGDFNCVSSDLDVTPNAIGTRKTGYIDGLRVVEDTHDLQDAWRELFPGVRGISHTCHASHTGGRLDRWLVPAILMPLIQKTDYVLGYPGDHQGVTLSIASPTAPDMGPGAWTFPLFLLDDAAYVKEMRGFISDFLQDFPVVPGFNRRQRWDFLKRSIRDHSTEFARVQRTRRRLRATALTNAAIAARQQFIAKPDDCTQLRWRVAHTSLQIHNTEQAAAAALRAGILWQQYGEQSTYYFYHVAQQRARATRFTSVLDPTPGSAPASLSTQMGRVRAGELLADFFSSDSPTGLFQPPRTSPTASAELLASVDKRLSTASSLACEGDQPITLAELSSALRGMPNGKQPGSDGLPYEFLGVFWDDLGQELTDVLMEAFDDPLGASLTPSQLLGTVTMIYKGRGHRSDPSSYRPITLLNCDIKLLGKALATRWGPHLSNVIDSTQTAFLPDRWIGDNVLSHMEEVDYLELNQEPGCLVFLDFSKAYDRLDRTWVHSCMQALGFGPDARRWVSLLHDGMHARVRYNGWLSPTFTVRSGLAQGSPLSPLLYVAAAQPLAAHLRAQVRTGSLTPISLPSGQAAPPSHQHADDTTLHLRSRSDVAVALQSSVALFCAASGSSVNPSKSQGLEVGRPAAFQGVDPATEIPFVAKGQTIKHLGVRMGTDPTQAANEMYKPILAAVRARVRHWSARQLSLLGRIHVAKQVLASVLTYHVTFVTPPPAVLRDLISSIMTFVSGTATTRMLPSKAVHSLPWDQGGTRLVSLHTVIVTMQAKVIARLLEPERLPWKEYFMSHLGMQSISQPLQTVSRRQVGALGYGLRTLFLSARLPLANARAASYVASFRALRPHRLIAPSKLSRDAVLLEPLFYNAQIISQGACLTPTGTFRPFMLAGVSTIGDLLAAPEGLRGPLLDTIVDSLPTEWRAMLYCPALPPQGWYLGPRADASVLRIVSAAAQVCEVYEVGSDGTLTPSLDAQTLTPPAHTLSRAIVSRWDPARPWRPGRSSTSAAPTSEAWYLYPTLFDPSSWGFGHKPVTEFVVRQAADRHSRLTAVAKGVLHHPLLPCKPAIWDFSTPLQSDDGACSSQQPATRGLSAIEARWSSVIHTAAIGRQAPQPAKRPLAVRYEAGALWMNTKPHAREHWEVRAERNRAECRDAPAAPTRRVEVRNDVIDAATGGPLPQEPWALVWSRLCDATLDRRHRLTAWQVLHGAVSSPAHEAYLACIRDAPDSSARSLDAYCQHPGCAEAGHLANLSHSLVLCPRSRAVWAWLGVLWTRITRTPAPPCLPAVYLADDQRSWKPSKGLGPLWTRLRLATLHVIVRDHRCHTRTATTSTLIALLVHTLRTALLQDARRLFLDMPSLADGLCSTTWLRGRRPGLTLSGFQRVWGPPGPHYVVSAGAIRVSLQVSLTT